MGLRFVFLTICVFLLLNTTSFADTTLENEEEAVYLSEEERDRLFRNTTLVGAGIVTVWGVLNWDYFSEAPSAQSEGWFGNDTESGGADKIGHAYTTYAFSHAISLLYEHWGFEQDDAALYGTLSSYLIMTYMELGDAFSDYGTSHEDLIANTAGALLGYILYKNDDLASKIDFRWEYDWSFGSSDITTDYENSRYLFALKLNGFETTRNTFLKHVEFHLGYYTRNFDNIGYDKERNLYVGIGLNLTDLLYRNNWRKTARVLRYIQLPYTSVSAEHDFN